MTSKKSVFFAYASTPSCLGEVIEQACSIANRFNVGLQFQTWRQNDIVGLDLIDPIRRAISEAEYIVADISVLNYNVIYEIGYAIGLGKRVILVRSENATVSNEELNRVGIFDTIGYDKYKTDVNLAHCITNELSLRKITTEFEKNYSWPLYVVSCAEVNDENGGEKLGHGSGGMELLRAA